MNDKSQGQLIDRVMDRMHQCVMAIGTDTIQHDVDGVAGFTPHDGYHRLVINGLEGPWVSKYATAHNGLYCATHPYHAGEMPRVFFAIEIHPHTIRQPGARDPKSARPVVSSPGPGVDAGIETPPPPSNGPPPSAAGGGEVPRLDHTQAPPACVDCGTTNTTHREDCRTLWALIGACMECGVPKGAHKKGCSQRVSMCMGCMGHGRVGHKAGVGGVDTRRDCRACGGSGNLR